MTLETQAAFARRLGKHKAYVTRLKQSGRLVMRDGRVDVEPSIERIEATASPLPHHEAVSDHHAQQRVAGDTLETLADAGLAHKRAMARKLKAEAEMAEMQRDLLAARLTETDSVKAAGLEAGALVRDGLYSLSDRVSAELAAEMDPAAIHARLNEEFENVLNEIARKVKELAKKRAT